jgi:membrane peptidoglycan carboxypeptidase
VGSQQPRKRASGKPALGNRSARGASARRAAGGGGGGGRRAGSATQRKGARAPFRPWDRQWWSRRRKAKKARLAAMTRSRRIWRRVGVAATWLLALLAVTMVVTVYAFYKVTDVPSPEQLRRDQIAIITYADGSEIGRIGEVNRTDVELAAVPESLKWAVLSTEDRDFYTDPGFSATSTIRAAWSTLSGGERQGGSGITQQYVKNAYLNSDQSLSRKLRELAISVKLNREYSKDQILEWYLNTVYFGRGAYGVQAAAQAYFGVDVSQVSVEQSAVLAALLKAPSLYDPAVDLQAAQDRWRLVLDGMVATGRLDAATSAAAQYPQTLAPDPSGGLGIPGPNGHLVAQIKAELAAHGIDESAINRDGLRITTTIEKPAQDAAVAAVQEVLSGEPEYLRQALVAISPATGGIVAYYGGADGANFDYAQSMQQPGSSFKPIVLATALAQNLAGGSPDGGSYSLQSAFDGSSPRVIDGQEINNAGGESCGRCSLATAMTRSINTVYYDLASRVGPANAAAMAHTLGVAPTDAAGAPTLQTNGVTDSRIGIGGYEVRTIDMASAYATIAAGGVLRTPHIVSSVTDASGAVIYQWADDAEQVVDPRVANDVAVSMRAVASYSNAALAGGRQSASKTGTVGIENSNDNSDSWMTGFTPQVSAAVWTGRDTNEPTYDSNGRPLYGSMLSAQTWKRFLDAYLADAPNEPIPATPQVGAAAPPPSSAPPTSEPPVTSEAPPVTSSAPAPSPTPTTSAPTTSTPPPPVEPTTAAPTTSDPPPVPSPPAPAPTDAAGGLPSAQDADGVVRRSPMQPAG